MNEMTHFNTFLNRLGQNGMPPIEPVEELEDLEAMLDKLESGRKVPIQGNVFLSPDLFATTIDTRHTAPKPNDMEPEGEPE